MPLQVIKDTIGLAALVAIFAAIASGQEISALFFGLFLADMAWPR